MTKRFTIETIEEELYPMPIYYDVNKELGYFEIVDLLNELYEENQTLKKIYDTNKNLGEGQWEIIKLIIEYDTTNKYSEKEVIEKIKDILGLEMVE